MTTGTATGATTLPGLLLRRAAERPNAVGLRKKELGRWKEYRWADCARRTESVALGLVDLGVKSGDRVAIHAGNRPAWLFADVAVQGIGAISVAVHPASTSPDVAAVLGHSGAVVLIAEDEEQLDKALVWYTKLLELNPKKIEAWANKRIALMKYMAALNAKSPGTPSDPAELKAKIDQIQAQLTEATQKITEFNKSKK